MFIIWMSSPPLNLPRLVYLEISQIHLAIWTDIFRNLDRYIYQSMKIFSNLVKYVSQVGRINNLDVCTNMWNCLKLFSYASSSTLNPRQRVSKSVIVSDCNLLAQLGACELVWIIIEQSYFYFGIENYMCLPPQIGNQFWDDHLHMTDIFWHTCPCLRPE